MTETKTKTPFPLVDALLVTPEEGGRGMIGICTNTSAPGAVLNEIAPELRSNVAVLGSLVVSRDGTERMILNSLAHPTLTYIILFSEESLTFSPSTNLLQAMRFGFDIERKGNYIEAGVAASAHYPSLNQKILDLFRQNIIVLPLYMYQSAYTKGILAEYLDWLKEKIPAELYQALVKANEGKKIYYDSLNDILRLMAKLPARDKPEITLDPKDFQHLQPPVISLPPTDKNYVVPFQVSARGKTISVKVKAEESIYEVEGDYDFGMAYSLMEVMGENKRSLSPLEQLLLGVEMARVSTEVTSGLSTPSLVTPKLSPASIVKVPLAPLMKLVPDQRYYYKVSVRENLISVLCMAFDVCEEVFDLRSESVGTIVEKLAELNRFEDYSMDILHRIDLGIQIGRAGIAAGNHYSFIQDFTPIFKVNKTGLPFVAVEGDTFLAVHKSVLTKIYTEGITEEHADAQKGLARTAAVLAIYRNASLALERMPALYKQGDKEPEEVREAYKAQLLRFDHDGSYSYGERTRSYFKFDQLERVKEVLSKNPNKAAIIQRFDPSTDMGTYVDPDTGKTKFTHDPCLTHDIFFINQNRLHSFHIARAHNAVNAYPENIFGLFDAYAAPIAKHLSLESGDMFMLSNRANILLLTEEQRTKKILGEPSKPSDELDTSMGPYQIGPNFGPVAAEKGVFVLNEQLVPSQIRPDSHTLATLENYEGVNTVERAIKYLAEKGLSHNNPVLSEYRAGKSDPQVECLVFFQANVFGKKLYATAVYANRDHKRVEEDKFLANYLAYKYCHDLDVEPGMLTLIYVS